MRPNWVKIRYEYITTNISYRELAAKHNVSFTTLSKRAKREGWADRRKNNDDRITEKALEKFSEEEVVRRQNIIETANTLLDRVDAILMMHAELDPKDVRTLAAALKDIKDCKNCLSYSNRRKPAATARGNPQKPCACPCAGRVCTADLHCNTFVNLALMHWEKLMA